ncbi:MAG: anti-sigma factor [Synechococcus sp.]
MTRSNHSENWHELLLDYVLGNLASEEAAALQQQISDNPELQKELLALQEALSTLPYTLPETNPPSRLKASILHAIEESGLQNPSPDRLARALPPEAKERRAKPRIWQKSRILGLSTSIAAGLVLALGLDNYRLRLKLDTTAQLQQQVQQYRVELSNQQDQLQTTSTLVRALQRTEPILLYGLEGTGQAEGVTGRLVMVPGREEIVFVSNNLPTLSEKQVYRLWAIAEESASPQYCGQFRSSTIGAVHWSAPTTSCSNNPIQLLITLDMFEDSIESAGPLVMQGQI